MAPGLVESRLLGTSGAWSQEWEPDVTGGASCQPQVLKGSPVQPSCGPGLRKVPALGCRWCWDKAVGESAWGPSLNQDQPQAPRGASREPALGQVGP